MIEEIVQREWDLFQKVRHIDGRADCQDDHETFYLQRKSQFEVYPQDLLDSYLKDLKEAELVGRNMIMEKYAYMMESTEPKYFQSIQDQLPYIDESKRELIDMICEIEVGMREEVNQKYPSLVTLARHVHTSEDTIDNISFETYLRGELCTYSSHSLYLYGQMIVKIFNQGENIVENILEHTVKAYGYSSLEQANEYYKNKKK